MPKKRRKTDGTVQKGRDVVALALDENPWIHEEAEARNWRCLHLDHCDYALPEGVRAKALLTSMESTDDRIRTFVDAGIPVVRVGVSPRLRDKKIPAVIFDRDLAGRVAAEHFAEHKFRHIAFFSNLPWDANKELFDAFSSRADQLGMVCHLEQFSGKPGMDRKDNMDLKRKQLIPWLRELPKPVGLFAPAPYWAIRYCLWSMEAGIDIPVELAVLSLGIHRSRLEWAFPSISYVEMNERERLRLACDLIDDLIAGKEAPSSAIKVPPLGVVQLESTNLLACDDEVVTRAVHFIWSYLDAKVTVDDVVAEAGLSRRQLERRFQQALGRGVNEEIRRKRFEETKRLLTNTDLPIEDVAVQVGFGSSQYLYQSFRKAFGTTPSKFRRDNR